MILVHEHVQLRQPGSESKRQATSVLAVRRFLVMTASTWCSSCSRPRPLHATRLAPRSRSFFDRRRPAGGARLLCEHRDAPGVRCQKAKSFAAIVVFLNLSSWPAARRACSRANTHSDRSRSRKGLSRIRCVLLLMPMLLGAFDGQSPTIEVLCVRSDLVRCSLSARSRRSSGIRRGGLSAFSPLSRAAQLRQWFGRRSDSRRQLPHFAIHGGRAATPCLSRERPPGAWPC